MKRKIIWGAGMIAIALAVGVSGLLLNPDPLIHTVIDKVVATRSAASDVPDHRFEVLFCGTGSPNRTPTRGQPCLAVIAGGRLFLFDAGEGAIGALTEYNAPLARLDTIFLTHLHSDHISGLGEVLHNTWLYGRTGQIDVIGPPGTAEVLAGFSRVYKTDMAERQRVLGKENIDPKWAMGQARDVLAPEEETLVVYENDGVTIEAFRVEHLDWPDAYGYRVTFAGKTVVISGDTRKTTAVPRVAQGADLLIHEALNNDAMSTVAEALDKHDIGVPGNRMTRIAEAHTLTLEVAEMARDAQVDHLILTHLIPALPANALTDRYFTKGMRDIYDGKITVARDGMRIRLAH